MAVKVRDFSTARSVLVLWQQVLFGRNDNTILMLFCGAFPNTKILL